MNTKNKAYQLFKEGTSYQEIAKILGIGKTTAYDYVKEMKQFQNTLPNAVPNGSKLNPNVRSERNSERKTIKGNANKQNDESTNKISVPNVPTKKVIKGFSANELLKMKFDTLTFTGKFFDLIGNPDIRFAGLIWGLPKGGKSNLSIRFADYLQEYFGDVLYVAAEEGISVSMQEKIKAIGGSDITLLATKNRDEIKGFMKSSIASFVFIDSINVVNIDDAFLEEMKQENPNKSFVAIVQATKGGNFKGEQSLEHNCDFVIKVVNGIAYHKGRFGPESETPIFEQPLYEKNANKKVLVDIKPASQAIVNTLPENFKIELPANFQYPIPTNLNIPIVQKPNFDFLNNLHFQPNNAALDLLGKALLFSAGFFILKEILKGDN